MIYNYSLLKDLPQFMNLDAENQEMIIEKLINYYLKKIKKLNNEKKIKDKYYDIQEVTDYFSYLYNKKLSEKEKNRYSVIEDCGETIADDLIDKIFLDNNRKVELPYSNHLYYTIFS